MKRIIAFLLIIIMLLSGCASKPDETATPDIEDKVEDKTPPPHEVTVTDSAGRVVTTTAEKSGIVSLCEEATSLLIALGVEKRVTGVEAGAKDNTLFFLAYEEIENVTEVTDEHGVITDAVIDLDPGLVVLGRHQTDLLEVLEHSGLICAVVALDSIDSINDSIELLGTLVNSAERATKLKNYYSSALERLTVFTMGEEEKTVSVYENDPFVTSMLSHLDCKIEDGAGVVIANSDADVEGAIKVPQAIEKWDRPCTALVLGIYWYAHKIYPTLFTDRELSQRAINFYSEFYGVKLTSEQVGIPVDNALGE